MLLSLIFLLLPVHVRMFSGNITVKDNNKNQGGKNSDSINVTDNDTNGLTILMITIILVMI